MNKCKDCGTKFSKTNKLQFDPFMQPVCPDCNTIIRAKIKQFATM